MVGEDVFPKLGYFSLFATYQLLNFPYKFISGISDSQYETTVYGEIARPSIVNYNLIKGMDYCLEKILSTSNSDDDSMFHRSCESVQSSIKRYLPYLENNLKNTKWYHFVI